MRANLANKSVEPTGGSRCAQSKFVSQRRLPPAAHAWCWAALIMGTRILRSALMLAVWVLAGCSSQPNVSSRASQEQTLATFKQQANQLYDAYLAGDREQAKHSLEQSIRLAEESKLPSTYQAGCLFFDYARLYVLERRGGSERSAEAALVKARYWSVREAELGGNSDEEAGARAKSETGDQIVAFIDKWDRDHTDGKGPNYARSQ